MSRIFASLFLAASISFALPQVAQAKEHDKVQIKKDFDEWNAKSTAAFESSWAGIQEAENTAKPLYDKAMALAKAGKGKEAIAGLLSARAKLYSGSNGKLVHIDKGLSFKIALGLAEQYENLGDKARVKREISFMDHGRPWMSKKTEHEVFMHYAIKEVYRVHRTEEAKSEDRMKTKERNRLNRIMKYLVVGANLDIIFEEGYNTKKSWEKSMEKAKKTFAKDDYKDYGGQEGTKSHNDRSPASAFKKGSLLLITNRKVTKVSGKKAIIDFREVSEVPVNCKSTGKVLDITIGGRFIYKQKCSFSKRQGGHKLILPLPKGLKLKKGDVVTMYAKVAKSEYDRSKKLSEVTLKTPGVVHSSRNGKTQWLLGVKTNKPSFIKADGDFRVKIIDDAEAPPTAR